MIFHLVNFPFKIQIVSKHDIGECLSGICCRFLCHKQQYLKSEASLEAV